MCATRLPPGVQVREPEVQRTAVTVLLARNLPSRRVPAQRIGVHPKVLRRLLCGEPLVALRLGEPKLDPLGDALGQAVEESENRV